MKKLLLILIFISSYAFCQQDSVKIITYNDMINQFHTVLGIKYSNIDDDVERCQFIIDDGDESDKAYQIAWKIFYTALSGSKVNDKNSAFLEIIESPDQYDFIYLKKNIGGITKKRLADEILKYNDNTHYKGDESETDHYLRYFFTYLMARKDLKW